MMRRRDFIALLGGGTIAAGARSADARQGTRHIAYLALYPGEINTHMKVFTERLRELGLVEGENLAVTYRSAEGRPERLPELASELVQLNPEVLVAGFGTLAAKAAKDATATIPVVFLVVGDPIGAGLIGRS
jgi:putative ABC transport system substrate-binding protein